MNQMKKHLFGEYKMSKNKFKRSNLDKYNKGKDRSRKNMENTISFGEL